MLQINTFALIGLVIFALFHLFYGQKTRTSFATVLTCGFLLPGTFAAELMTAVMTYVESKRDPRVVIGVDLVMIGICFWMVRRYGSKFQNVAFPASFSAAMFKRIGLFIPVVFVAALGLFFGNQRGQWTFIICGFVATAIFVETFVYLLRFYEKIVEDDLDISE